MTFISARIQYSNGIPTAIPMFWGSENMERLAGMLSDVQVCRKSKMQTFTGSRNDIMDKA